MAAEKRAPRNRLDSALVDRSRTTSRAGAQDSEMRSGKAKRVHGAARLRAAPALSKSELDDIYSLGSEDEADDDMRRRKMLKKARTDVGDRSRVYTPNQAAKALPTHARPGLQRSTSEVGAQTRIILSKPASPRARPLESLPVENLQSAPPTQPTSRRRPGSTTGHAAPGRASLSRTSSDETPRANTQTATAKNVKLRSGRVRLIDQLASQAEELSGADADADADGSDASPSQTSSQNLDLSVLPELPATPLKTGEPTLRSHPTSQSVRRANGRTYSQQRSIRTESSNERGLGGLGGLQDHDATPTGKFSSIDTFAFEEDELEDVRPKGGILGLHALRQAGANHRFSNDLHDLYERIGTPQALGTAGAFSRRSALLELGRKLQDRKFLSQFCDDSSNDVIFRQAGNEKDTVSGFILVSALIMLLAHSAAAHLVQQVYQWGFDSLLERLLTLDEDVSPMSRERSTNLSKHSQASLQALRTVLVQSSNIWTSAAPAVLSPRIISLKALAMACKASFSASVAQALERLTPRLFEILRGSERCLEEEHGIDEEGTEMALSLLQRVPVSVWKSTRGSSWLKKYLPSVAVILSHVLGAVESEGRTIESQALKLAMNTSNSALSAADYGSDELLRGLAEAALSRFRALHTTAVPGNFPAELYGRLVLVLGLLINIVEHYPPSRERFGHRHDTESPLSGLLAVYLDHRETIGRADSYEKTQLAVAHGYLAIFLGYISVDNTGRKWLADRGGGQAAAHLLSSIREFLALHEKLAAATPDDMTTSLEKLVTELQLQSQA